jgi:hypothetical protein
LLESTREPIQVQSLITGVTEAHGEAGREVNLAAVQKLAHIGLLCEVPPS